MTTNANEAPPSRRTRTIDDIWRPIMEQDLKWGRVPRPSAAGPDGVTPRLFRAVPTEILLRIYNIIMWCERLPEDLLKSRTIFLPKKTDAVEPGDFRPITIPSVIVRGLHKILAKRMEVMLDIDPRERAFRNTDGCADNTFLLDTILRSHRRNFKSVYMASLDVSKAFDSVSHPAIETALTEIGVPRPMVRYLAEIYRESRTRLEGDTWSSAYIHPGRGVRQGDPLSPVIFNVITHHMLQQLPDDIGIHLGDTLINAVAFADDLLLIATTSPGLQRLIDGAAAYLGDCGMTINPAKSMTVSIRAAPHIKKTMVDVSATFTCGGQQLPSLSRSNKWRYLGVIFTPEGRTMCRPREVL
ncbi:reverse transcriptase [Lasius niger]|uniref:Reverse transcriptase n=1 Tax=Lasius niger TaxID=67767 RepID=A0A0J7KDR5_LASNI|nr:reverse transcriptase [Lasius niger]